MHDEVVRRVLPNGLTVLLREDHSSPVVAVNMWFKVGSVNETDDMNGLAHFQEHMVFKGTEKYGVGEIPNIVRSAGGNLNAATSYSYTMYYVVLPSRAFSLGLSVQADAMMNSTFDPDEFQKERLVVIDEARMYDDTPDAFTFYRTMELAYKKHNYRRPIAGYEKVVRNFSRDQLLDFYRAHYRPSNAILVVVGDVNQDTAMADIEAVYGPWEDRSVNIYDSPAEPPQEQFRFRVFRGAIDHAYLGMGFHVPDSLDPDYPVLEMIGTLLGSGKSSRLYRNVLEEKRLATTVNAELLSEKWPGYFMLFASTPGGKWKETRDALFEELNFLKYELVGTEELLKARRQIQKHMYSEMETMEGQASNLGYYEVMGDYMLLDRHLDAIMKVTPKEIMAVARRYFNPDGCSLVAYLPKENGDVEIKAESVEHAAKSTLTASPPSAPPTASHGKPTAGREGDASGPGRSRTKNTKAMHPQVHHFELDNGLRVLVKRRTTVPMVAMLTVVQGGTRLDPGGKSGLSILTSRSLIKGTRSFDAEEIVSSIERLGGSIESFSSFDAAGVYVNILSEHIKDALPIYREILREPKFSPKEVDKEKNKMIKELAKRHDNPIYFSMDNLFANVFGNHPYSFPYHRDESQLTNLADEDCRKWYGGVLVPENVVLVFVGDITPEKAREVSQHLFGDLKPGSPPSPATEAPAEPVSPGIHELTRAHLKQSVGLVGFIAPPMMTKEAISLEVLNGVMTGLGGRLFVELRDKRSLGYMVGSSLLPLKERSIFFGYSNPNAEGLDEALEVIRAELVRTAREAVSDEELKRSKEWLIGSQVMNLQRNFAQAIAYGTYEALGFGYDVVDRTPEIIQKVTQDSILNAAASVFEGKTSVFIKLTPEPDGESAQT
jgi:zinc protease